MKFYLLVVFMTWTMGGMENQPVQQGIVESPEHAAVHMWTQQSQEFMDGRILNGKLYELNFEDNTIKEVPIPRIKFGGCNECPNHNIGESAVQGSAKQTHKGFMRSPLN